MTKDHAPPFPPECQTEAEKKAFAFGWFKALEAQRLAQREWVELTDEEIETLIHRFDGDPHTLLDEVNARLKKKNT